MRQRFNVILLFLIVGCFHFNVQGQAFPKISDHPTWRVGLRNFWTANCEDLHWKYGDSLVICGKKYIQALECDYNDLNCTVKGFVRLDSEKVYVRKTMLCNEKERLMYDFSLPINGGYNMAYNLGVYDSTAAKVTATQTQTYFAVNRLTQSITYTVDPPANMYSDVFLAIRGIGSDVHPFFPLICFGDFCETDIQLMEYRENNVILFSRQPVFPAPCSSWVGIAENSNVNPVSVFPNPAKDQVHIQSAARIRQAVLIDCMGRVCEIVRPSANNFSIGLSDLAPGYYSLLLSTDKAGAAQAIKILKTE